MSTNPQFQMPHEHRQASIGVMTHGGRRLQTEPLYVRSLIASNLISKHMNISSAYKIWQRVVVDPVVQKYEERVMKEQQHKQTFSSTPRNQWLAWALAAMSVQDLEALKSRISVL
jgi:hypothetical protein